MPSAQSRREKEQPSSSHSSGASARSPVTAIHACLSSAPCEEAPLWRPRRPARSLYSNHASPVMFSDRWSSRCIGHHSSGVGHACDGS